MLVVLFWLLDVAGLLCDLYRIGLEFRGPGDQRMRAQDPQDLGLNTRVGPGDQETTGPQDQGYFLAGNFDFVPVSSRFLHSRKSGGKHVHQCPHRIDGFVLTQWPLCKIGKKKFGKRSSSGLITKLRHVPLTNQGCTASVGCGIHESRSQSLVLLQQGRRFVQTSKPTPIPKKSWNALKSQPQGPPTASEPQFFQNSVRVAPIQTYVYMYVYIYIYVFPQFSTAT